MTKTGLMIIRKRKTSHNNITPDLDCQREYNNRNRRRTLKVNISLIDKSITIISKKRKYFNI